MDQLEQLARRGARQMLSVALEEAVEAYLGRRRCERVRDHEGVVDVSAPVIDLLRAR